MQIDTEKPSFHELDIVWAKVRGHAWWPAIVGKMVVTRKDFDAKHEVHFLGDATRAQLAPHFLRHFEEGFLDCAFVKHAGKGLKAAVMQACK